MFLLTIFSNERFLNIQLKKEITEYYNILLTLVCFINEDKSKRYS